MICCRLDAHSCSFPRALISASDGCLLNKTDFGSLMEFRSWFPINSSPWRDSNTQALDKRASWVSANSRPKDYHQKRFSCIDLFFARSTFGLPRVNTRFYDKPFHSPYRCATVVNSWIFLVDLLIAT
jgi:hypothetical protein